ncbi:MAG: 50S ribosomal protein L9 [Gammaproteobacteria bacterium]|nr:50S ribosomal protein L9 [Gammaproteobacteria bacterium]
MEVILLENIENLGTLGDKVSVKSGFARNYLVPHGKAKIATVANLAEFEARRAELEKAVADALGEAQTRQQAIEALGTLEIAAKVGSEGKLFGSIGTADIAEAIAAAGVVVEKREIRLPDGAIRITGEHVIDIHVHADVDSSVTISIVGEDGIDPMSESTE